MRLALTLHNAQAELGGDKPIIHQRWLTSCWGFIHKLGYFAEAWEWFKTLWDPVGFRKVITYKTGTIFFFLRLNDSQKKKKGGPKMY